MDFIKVTNRYSGIVAYQIQDSHVIRRFQPNESKNISLDELTALAFQPGGQILLGEYLLVESSKARVDLLGETEPEYDYTEAQVRELLISGTIEELADCLAFAPKGVIELIKDISVSTKLNDISKRDLIFKEIGFDITGAINIAEDMKSDEGTGDTATQSKPKRLAKPFATSAETLKPIKKTSPLTK